MKAITLIGLGCLLIVISIGVISQEEKSHYDRWTELSGQEILFVRNCVKSQKYLTCLENVHQMRQIGIVP